jgi:hypothetical protein
LIDADGVERTLGALGQRAAEWLPPTCFEAMNGKIVGRLRAGRQRDLQGCQFADGQVVRSQVIGRAPQRPGLAASVDGDLTFAFECKGGHHDGSIAGGGENRAARRAENTNRAGGIGEGCNIVHQDAHALDPQDTGSIHHDDFEDIPIVGKRRRVPGSDSRIDDGDRRCRLHDGWRCRRIVAPPHAHRVILEASIFEVFGGSTDGNQAAHCLSLCGRRHRWVRRRNVDLERGSRRRSVGNQTTVEGAHLENMHAFHQAECRRDKAQVRPADGHLPGTVVEAQLVAQ